MTSNPVFSVSVAEDEYGDGAPITLQGGILEGIKTASALGYDGVELQLHTPLKCDFQQYASWAGEQNIKITAIGTGLESFVHGLFFTAPELSQRKKLRQSFMQFIDGASDCSRDTSVFLGLCRGKAPSLSEQKAYLERLGEELRILADYAGEKEVKLVLEPIVFYLTNLINTTDEGLEFLSRPGLESIELLLDTHHMFIEDKDMIHSFRKAANHIGHIHISDSNRQFAGSGNVAYEQVGHVLKEIGYSGPLSLECLPVPSGIKAAEYSLDWMKKTWPENRPTRR